MSEHGGLDYVLENGFGEELIDFRTITDLPSKGGCREVEDVKGNILDSGLSK